MPASVCPIVINHFGAAKAERCLSSLIHESLTTLVLVDNSADAVEHAALDVLVTDLRTESSAFGIRRIYNRENLGFGRGINRAIAADLECRGDPRSGGWAACSSRCRLTSRARVTSYPLG